MSVEQERQARLDAVTQQVKVYRAMLPVLLGRLSKIADPRNPRKIRHKLTVLMIYGILCFAFQMSSRREANRQMTLPMFEENLRRLFPDLEELPHQDTLARLLARIEVDQIEQAHLDLIRQLVRSKKFRRYLIGGCYPIAMTAPKSSPVRNVGMPPAWNGKSAAKKTPRSRVRRRSRTSNITFTWWKPTWPSRMAWSFPCSAKC